MLIKANFLDQNDQPKFTGYTYATDDNVKIGDIVYTANGSKMMVSQINLPNSEGDKWGDTLKNLTLIPPEKAQEETTKLKEGNILCQQN